ncbi:TPA: metal-sensitive transcriptional regulator [Streptococcus suis 2524]|uniref:metal-sensitive transcriptional regulator n=1 Tax=Streptococcus suis TaxID=1307 RepID=UPI0003FECEE7|nr:metal-sensitive transcriptional regulator [Streptococcus suis]HEM3216734.1 metal-sensitive transcriptional regulator [Streptococcus suis 2524]HEM4180014.1 metal-sensitive transcriptional regulator [Streptococcus suis]HEM4977353.1 metal-sensitive transcriptional regulator [Streptococcus suis]
MNTEKKKMINRLKRAEGQLRGIQKMIEEDQECIDIVTQLSAVRSSINSMMGMVIAQKVQDCIIHPSENPEEQEARLAQAINLIIKK